MWTPEPVVLPVTDALQMAKGNVLTSVLPLFLLRIMTAVAASGFDLVVVHRAEVPVCVIMKFIRRTCWL
jgi:hypothetical protein